MAKIILHSPYYKPFRGKSMHHFVTYLATRPGVQFPESVKLNNPATATQRNLLEDLIAAFPECREFFEYEDYRAAPTIKHASALIDRVFDTYPEQFQDRKNFVHYVASRPRVQKIAEHGLFSDYGKPVALDSVAKEISGHTGNVWTHIVSLRREDAARLGFDHVKAWRDLLCAKRNEIARHMKIDPRNFRWYAAFHDESHHPHVHMIAYSADPGEPYLTKNGIREIKACLAKEIFQDDNYHIYKRQTEYRDAIKENSRQLIEDIVERINSGVFYRPEVEMLLLELSKRLGNTSGKKVYGYLKTDVKNIVDSIVDEIAADEGIAALYDLWYEQRFAVIRNYTDELPEKVSLSQNREFKPVKKMVIQEALKIPGGHMAGEENPVSGDTPVNEVDKNTSPLSADRQSVDSGEGIVSNRNSAYIVLPIRYESKPGNFAAAGSLRLFQQICRAIQDRMPADRGNGVRRTEKKLLREIDEKKQAHGLRQ